MNINLLQFYAMIFIITVLNDGLKYDSHSIKSIFCIKVLIFFFTLYPSILVVILLHYLTFPFQHNHILIKPGWIHKKTHIVRNLYESVVDIQYVISKTVYVIMFISFIYFFYEQLFPPNACIKIYRKMKSPSSSIVKKKSKMIFDDVKCVA